MSRADAALPAGEVYDWYTRGMQLLAAGDAAAAAQLLEHAARAEPDARSVREGLARALVELPAVVVLEYPLPVAGRPLVEVLRERRELAATRILCVTARAIVEELEAIRGSGVDDVATKPLNLDDLCGRVQRLCPPES